MNKIVTICGSMRFQEQMKSIAEGLELTEKYIVIQCIYPNDGRPLTPEEIGLLGELHYRKIEISDAIYVVNVDGYIGESVRREIEYARSLGKEVMYLESADV